MIARTPLAIVSSPRVGPDGLLLERLRVQARRQAPLAEDLDQVVQVLRREPARAPFDDPRVSDLRVDRRGRLDHPVEEDRELVLEVPAVLGQVLAGQDAELPAAGPVEGEADGGLVVVILLDVRLGQELAGHVLAVDLVQDVPLDPARGDLLLADDRVHRQRGRGVADDPAGVVLDPVRLDRLELVRGLELERVDRVPVDRDGDLGVVLAGRALAGQVDRPPREGVLDPSLGRVLDRESLRVGRRVRAGDRLAELGPSVSRGGLSRPSLPSALSMTLRSCL